MVVGMLATAHRSSKNRSLYSSPVGCVSVRSLCVFEHCLFFAQLERFGGLPLVKRMPFTAAIARTTTRVHPRSKMSRVYSPDSPRVRPYSSRVRKRLLLCKEKTLKDEIRVTVIIDTRANCLAKKWAKKFEKMLKLSPKDKAPKTWKFRHLPLCAKGATLNHCAMVSTWLVQPHVSEKVTPRYR